MFEKSNMCTFYTWKGVSKTIISDSMHFMYKHFMCESVSKIICLNCTPEEIISIRLSKGVSKSYLCTFYT